MQGRASHARLDVELLTPDTGALVRGVGISDALSDQDVAAAIRAAFTQYKVLVFRDQRIDAEQHKAFGRLFGELHVHPSKRSLGAGGDPELFTVKATPDTTPVNGGRWHMDVSCEAMPPAASILRLIEGPETAGDTVFADTHRAFTSLSAPLRHMLNGLDARHDGLRDLRWYGVTPKPGQSYPAATHPVVVRHPDSGLPVLFVNEAFTESLIGMSGFESERLLGLLFDHIARTPSLQCRVTWAPGTVVMWDNFAVQHHAVWDYAPAVRRGERVSIAGSVSPARWMPT